MVTIIAWRSNGLQFESWSNRLILDLFKKRRTKQSIAKTNKAEKGPKNIFRFYPPASEVSREVANLFAIYTCPINKTWMCGTDAIIQRIPWVKT